MFKDKGMEVMDIAIAIAKVTRGVTHLRMMTGRPIHDSAGSLKKKERDNFDARRYRI